MGYELPNVDFKDTRKNVRQFGEGEDIIEVWEEDGQDVWLEQWIEDFVNEDNGEIVPIERMASSSNRRKSMEKGGRK